MFCRRVFGFLVDFALFRGISWKYLNFVGCDRAKYQKPCSFEINFKESKIFKYVHVQMALPKKIFKCLFFLG